MFSLLGGVLTLALAAILVFIFTLGTTYYGITERAVVAVPFIWLAVTGAKFYTRMS